jgi:aspartokinase/homoserine dehydrogenase 1
VLFSRRRPMRLHVLKFGGSVLDRPEAVATLVRIVAARAALAPTVVVVSALKGVTERLYAAVAAAGSGDGDRATAILEDVGALHRDVAAACLDADARDRVQATCTRLVARLTEICSAVSVLATVPSHARDEVAGAGERLSAVLVAESLRMAGVAADSVDAAEVVVVEETESGVVDLARTRAAACDRVASLAHKGRVPIVTGFVASTGDARPATLGRGGSDLTASVLARVLDAESVTFFKDVDGVYSADPCLVADARVQPFLSHEEARELAALGARFLHPHALEPLLGSGARIEFRGVANPEIRGTLVAGGATAGDPAIRAVVASGDLCAVSCAERDASPVDSFRARALWALAETGRTALLVADAMGGGSNLCVLVGAADALGVKAALERVFVAEIAAGAIRQMRLDWGLVAASIVGDGVATSPRLAAAAISALAERGAGVRSVSRSDSGTSLRFVLDGCTAEVATSALHALVAREVDGDPPLAVLTEVQHGCNLSPVGLSQSKEGSL